MIETLARLGALSSFALVSAACAVGGDTAPPGTDAPTPASLSSCDAAEPSGDTMLESTTSDRRTVEVRLPLLPGWERSESTAPALGEGSRVEQSGAWATATSDIVLTPPDPAPSNPFSRRPQSPESLSIAIDDVRHGSVCGHDAVLKRQHPTSYASANPYLRAELTITCQCGSTDRPVTIVVTINTHEPAGGDSRSPVAKSPPRYPSGFESDIATILGNVEVDWMTA